MTAQAQLLDRLSELRPADRAWILNQLSGRERAALMDAARRDSDSMPEGEPAPRPTATAVPSSAEASSAAAQRLMSDQVSLVQSCDVEQVLNTLRAEPPWLIAAVLSLEPWRWSRELLERLPSHVRIEVMRLRDKPLTIADGMRAALLNSCAERIPQSEVPRRSVLRGIFRGVQAKLLNRRRTLRL